MDVAGWPWTINPRSGDGLRAPCATLDVIDAPFSTPHRLMILTTAVSAAEIADDPERWNWSRHAFSDRTRALLCATLLDPVMSFLLNLWLFVGQELDSQLLEAADDIDALDREAQAIIDEAYDLTCRSVRDALVGMAYWSPTRARRGYQAQKHLDWADMACTSNSLFLSKVKSALDGAKSQQAQNLPPEEYPTVNKFGECYRNLFSASADSPREPSSLEAYEKRAFGAIEDLLKRAQWGKAIGPDNLPADIFKCCRCSSAPMLQSMFTVFWAHQIMPNVWRRAFISPIQKSGSDLRDPEQWRGIALQSHTKKLFEVCIRGMCRDKEWTKTHLMQTGFQPRKGAIEAILPWMS